MKREMFTSFAISAGLTFALSIGSGFANALTMALILGTVSVGVCWILNRK